MPAGIAIGAASVVSAGASLVASGRQADAIERGADTQAQAANDSARVQREIYYDQAERLEPFRGLGLSAINPMAALMGLDYQYSPQAAQSQQYRPANDSGLASLGGFGGDMRVPAGGVSGSYGNYGLSGLGSFGGTMPTGAQNGAQGAGTGADGGIASIGTQTPAAANSDPLAALQSRPGYQFRLRQGNDAYEASAAARGLGNSGAQLRALAQYNQDYASNEYDNEFNRLSALMGGGQVATNSINQAASQYGTNAGNALMNAGNARASGYVGAANANAAGLTGAANALGTGLGYLGASQGWWGQ